MLPFFCYALLLLLTKVHIGLALLIVAVMVISSLLVRLSYGFLQDFSGMGYTIEFFAHVEWKSLKVAFSEYGYASLPIVALLALTIWAISRLAKSLHRKSIAEGFLALALSGIFVYFGSNSTPEVMFAEGYQEFVSAGEIAELSSEEIRSNALMLLTPLRASRPLPKEKDLIQVTAPEQPYNVIIVYLESFNENLTENKSYPGLTPKIDAMKQAHFSFPYNFSSGYVTIEGIFNSQCGTLVNMAYANNSLQKSGGRMPNLPCLGDVLNKAGYTQVYLGGADISFAGKGDYLLDHGYDQVLGLNHWKAEGYKNIKGTWGLPDSQLFDEAIKKIEVLHAKPEPFNLTLLTLGTHVPGYPYEGCPDYMQSEERFIDAIHCTDFLLDKFVRQLETKGLLEDTLVYIQADHGVFQSRDMHRLFGKKGVLDRRLLTMAIVPEKRKQSLSKWDTQKQMASLDMVANILDLLEVKHDADFILARSSVTGGFKPRYQLTRYADYSAQQERISNHLRGCNSNEDRQALVEFPLDNCDKRQVMKTVYSLGSTYSDKPADSLVCDLGAETYLDPLTNIFHLRWGAETVTGKFYGAGRSVLKRKGVFVLILDSKDQIVQQLFFSSRFKKTLVKLQQTLKNVKAGHHVILATNTHIEDVEEVLKPLWPAELQQASFAYMTQTRYGFEIEESLSGIDFSATIRPASCEGGLQVTTASHPLQIGESEFCEIEAWGPKSARQDQPFNQQPNGNSAFWLKTTCAPENVSILFDDRLVKTTRNLPVITGGFNASNSLSLPGNYSVKLYDPSTGDRKYVGELQVKPQ